MRIETTRFGTLDLDDNDLIVFRHGMVGFPKEHRFVLLRRDDHASVGWLQSADTGSLAFPVVTVEALSVELPRAELEAAVGRAGLGELTDSYAVMAVICAAGPMPTVNLLAPIVVNADTRSGAQVFLDNCPLSTQEPFVLRRKEVVHREQPPVELQQAAGAY